MKRELVKVFPWHEKRKEKKIHPCLLTAVNAISLSPPFLLRHVSKKENCGITDTAGVTFNSDAKIGIAFLCVVVDKENLISPHM